MSALWISLKVATLATALMLAAGIPLGYLLARRRFPLRNLVQAISSLPLLLPPVVSGFLLLWLFAPQGLLGRPLAGLGIQLLYSWEIAALAAALVAFPLLLRSVVVAFEEVDGSLEAAAANLGATPREIFLRITLPLARRGLLAGILLGFGRALGEFGATILVAGNIPGRTQTIPLAIFSLSQGSELSRVWPYLGAITLLAFALMSGADLMQKRDRR